MGYSDQERLRGVAGWLAFLCIVLMFISPAWSLIGTGIEFNGAERDHPGLSEIPEWRTVKIFVWLLTGAGAVLSIYAGWRLNSVHRPSSVRLAIATMWALGPGSLLIGGAVAALAFDVAFLSDPQDTRDLARSIAAPSLWTFYLLLSRRVKNTYYEEDEAVTGEGPAAAEEPTR
ncbi:DUF2569 family protein [Allosphingosinicella sp.]|jgi:hypothetical protein|uniref:DUF2569 family protein n=1 Tax=Allosphingosinicella sp. TaxID=2823234 RepID=UPI002F01C6D8